MAAFRGVAGFAGHSGQAAAKVLAVAGSAGRKAPSAGSQTMEEIARFIEPACFRMAAGPVMAGIAAYPGNAAPVIAAVAAGAVSQAGLSKADTVEPAVAEGQASLPKGDRSV